MGLRTVLLASSLLVATVVACGDTPVFSWTTEIWATDAETQSIARMEGETLVVKPTSDPYFNELICMPKDGPRQAVNACNQIIRKCKVWEK
jgi:hypothetical protein